MDDSTTGRQIFAYLAELAELDVKPRPAIDTWDTGRLPTPLIWLAETPDHPGVACALDGRRRPGDLTVMLRVDQPALPEPPAPPTVWEAWAQDNGVDFDPRRDSDVPQPDAGITTFDAGAVAAAARVYQERIDAWRPWWRRADEARALYSWLWDARQLVLGEPELYEVVAGVGLLDWRHGRHHARRPVVVVPCEITFDAGTGSVEVRADVAQLDVETDMLVADRRPDPALVARVAAELRDVDDLLDPTAVAEPLRDLVRRLPLSGGRGTYDAHPAPPPGGSDHPTVTFAPLIAVRPRSVQARIDTLRALAATGRLSDPVSTMVTATAQGTAAQDASAHDDATRGEGARGEGAAPATAAPEPGAGDDRFDPDTLLLEQSAPVVRRVARSVAERPLTVLLAPPGSGATSAVADLVGHLVADGKRVLVTAEREATLHGVRDAVPEPLRPLVATRFAGDGREPFGAAVRGVARVRQRELDQRRTQLAEAQQKVEALQAERSERHDACVRALQAGAAEPDELTGPYRGDLDAVRKQVDADRRVYGWLRDRPEAAELELSQEDLDAAARSVIDRRFAAMADDDHTLPDPETVPGKEEVERLCAGLRAARGRAAELADAAGRPVAARVAGGSEAMLTVARALRDAGSRLRTIQDLPIGWAQDVLLAARRGKLDHWRGRLVRTRRSAQVLERAAAAFGRHRVEVPAGVSPDVAHQAAQTIIEHVARGERIPRLLRSRPLKVAVAALEGVTVDGAPVDRAQAPLVVAWTDTLREVAGAAEEWAGIAPLPDDAGLDAIADAVQARAQALGNLLDDIDAVAELTGSVGVDLDDRWDATGLLEDADAIEFRAHVDTEQRHAETLVRHQRGLHGTADVVEELRDALDTARRTGAASAWEEALGALEQARADREEALRGRRALERVAEMVPEFAATCDDDPITFAERLLLLPHAWHWARAAAVVERTSAPTALREALDDVERRLTRARRDLAEHRGWLRAAERLDGDERLVRAVRDYMTAQRGVPRTPAARTYPSLVRTAAAALEGCRDVVPAWVVPAGRAAEMFGGDAGPDTFDVVIVDGASQSPVTTAFALQWARSAVIVGDPHQTTPPTSRYVNLVQAARRQIQPRVARERLAPEACLWDVAAGAVDAVQVTGHAGCPPEVISWAAQHVYPKLAGLPLRSVAPAPLDRPKPVITTFVSNGVRLGDTNAVEAGAVVDDLEKLLADRPAWVGSVGVTAPRAAQVALLRRMIHDRLDPAQLERVRLRVGTPYDLQGVACDVLYLSLVDSAPADGGVLPLQGFDSPLVRDLNVAVSRTRHQLRLFHSSHATKYRPGDVRRSLLTHMAEADSRWEARRPPAVPEPAPDDRVVEPFASLPQQQLFNLLVERGFAARAQVASPLHPDGFRLPLVVEGAGGITVVTGDGPAEVDAARFLAEREHERELTCYGWSVVHVRYGELETDPARTVDDLVRELRGLGIAPVATWGAAVAAEEERPAPDTAAPDPPAAVEESPPAGRSAPDVAAPADGPDEAPAEAADADAAATPVEERPADVPQRAEVPRGAADVRAPSVRRASGSVPPRPAHAEPPGHLPHRRTARTGRRRSIWARPAVPEPVLAHGAADARPRGPKPAGARGAGVYTEFEGETVDPSVSPEPEVVAGLLRIVAVEGPVLGQRLREVYAAAAGITVNGPMRWALNRAIAVALRNGDLVEDDPLLVTGTSRRTYRLPDQPKVRRRPLGPRRLEDVPPAELAAHLHMARRRGLDQDGAYHRVVADLGCGPLTPALREALDDAWSLLT